MVDKQCLWQAVGKLAAQCADHSTLCGRWYAGYVHLGPDQCEHVHYTHVVDRPAPMLLHVLMHRLCPISPAAARIRVHDIRKFLGHDRMLIRGQMAFCQ